jgi:hypothetical protein
MKTTALFLQWAGSSVHAFNNQPTMHAVSPKQSLPTFLQVGLL